ncbi:Oidioi.mRNA.OKI2018_I69.chr2.g7234.t1.cds [Oikopleura dioica]|uniref:Oidioi.mRNA.OKI2018_I69.chr2.g7234.t1.cds n=1 Tax=Oikopleura dioica TaxID=34765 RepID=A0ABN7T5I6_OIKDI|nr:Oidioi.mRNA.OKI2018_I69.chr2.g7234.t1.cds [Oikopleura dioica]
MNGFSTISNPKNHVFSRISWGILLLLGVTFTVKNIADCFSKYLSYPTITKTSEIPVNASVEAFPKLTICLNSQQSIWKIQKYYPDTYEEILAGLPFLYGSYGDNHGEKFRDFRYKDRSVLDSLDLEKFMNSTSGEMEIIACKFLNRDCRDSWDKILTIYGTCLVFTPSSELQYFEKYTMKHCQMECLIKEIKTKCHCNAPFFPYLAKIDDLGFCNFTQHSFCVSNQIVAHDNLECQGCELECDSENFVHGNLQYAELDLKSPDHRSDGLDS